MGSSSKLLFTTGIVIEFDYVNWKGESSHRRVRVEDVWYGETDFHTEPQWLMNGRDLDKGAARLFAM